MKYSYEFANLLKDLRENLNLTQEDVEFYTGISLRTISRLENGNIQKPTIETLISLSRVYQVDLVDIYIGKCYTNYTMFKSLYNNLNLDLDSFDFSQKKFIMNYIQQSDDRTSIINNKELNLIKIYIDYLEKDDKTILLSRFNEITDNKFKNEKFMATSNNILELRLLINICNEYKTYGSLHRNEILEFCLKNNRSPVINLLSYISLTNSLYIDEEYERSLKILNDAIPYAKSVGSIDGLTCLYYNKFLCENKLDLSDSLDSLRLSKIFANHSKNDGLGKIISIKSKILIDRKSIIWHNNLFRFLFW